MKAPGYYFVDKDNGFALMICKNEFQSSDPIKIERNKNNPEVVQF